MSWHQLALNPQSLDSLYDVVPALGSVELFSIELDRDSAQLQIRVELPIFPDKPSARWHKNFNRVQIKLSFLGIENFQAQGWDRSMKVRIEINKRDGGLDVALSNPEIDLAYSFQTGFMRIENISAYQAEQPQK